MTTRQIAAILLTTLLLGACQSSSAPATTQGPSANPPVEAGQVTQDERFVASDGVTLLTRVGGAGSLAPRPVIVEFSPYSPGCCASYAGPEYNYLQVHIRGTGDSDGGFDALGPRTQQDMIEVLQWACTQPWSNGQVGLYGFSASAIMVYNSLHLKLPDCVKTASLMAGTHELYRDLLYPGGAPNLVAGTYVLVGIGGPAAANAFSRAGRNPLTSTLDPTLAMIGVGLNYIAHPTLDDWWLERGMRGDINHLPILMVTSFYDVEPRGPFQAFQELRGNGAHLLVVGAHDGVPVGTEDVRFNERKRWYDHYLRGIGSGIESDAPVRMYLSNGDRVDYLHGDFLPYDAGNWPVPGTTWATLALDPQRSGTARTVNDGTLSLAAPAATATQPLLEIPSLPLATDPYTTAVVGGIGAGSYSFNTLFTAIPQLDDMTLVEPLSLSWTTAPLDRDVISAGPASLEIEVATTTLESDLYAVLADVWPDGSAHPVSTARLRTGFPNIDAEKSLKDAAGNVVQPYGIYSSKDRAIPGVKRRYSMEFWPIGNRFLSGHRLRLYLTGVSAYHLPAGVGVELVSTGGVGGSLIRIPVLPGSDLAGALQ